MVAEYRVARHKLDALLPCAWVPSYKLSDVVRANCYHVFGLIMSKNLEFKCIYSGCRHAHDWRG